MNIQNQFDEIIKKMAYLVKVLNEDESVDESTIDKLNSEISDMTVKVLNKDNNFVKLEDLDDYIMNIIGKNYFVDRRCWDYLYDAIRDDVFNYMKFKESMQTGLGMAQELPTNSVYDGKIDDLYSDKEETKEMDKRLREKKISSDEKKKALADHLGVDVEEINDGYDDNDFEVNGEEYKVLTEDESYDEFKDWEMSLIDDLGLELFNENFQKHILENCIDESWFEQVAEEESDYYISEMNDEELLDYAHEHKIVKNIDDVDDENFDRSEIEDECKEVYEKEILDQGISEYFEDIYGRGWAKEMKDTLESEIDWDKVIEDLYDWDGRDTAWGSMASYDGKIRELDKVNGEWLFAYRIN